MIRYVLLYDARLNNLLPSQQDLSADVSVRPDVGAVELLRQCITAIEGEWHEWSFGYGLPEEVAHIECKGARVGGDKDCIVQYFVKKPRGRGVAGAVRQYDFSLILDVKLVIKGSFFDLVDAHREQALQAAESDLNKVCGF